MTESDNGILLERFSSVELKTKGCKHCRFTKHIPTSFDPSRGSDFVECPYCGDDTNFRRVIGWSPRDTVKKEGENEMAKTDKRDGGPAFPHVKESVPGHPDVVRTITDGGMSLRDWFAGMAMQAILSQGSQAVKWHDETAAVAYQAAEAMIKKRKWFISSS